MIVYREKLDPNWFDFEKDWNMTDKPKPKPGKPGGFYKPRPGSPRPAPTPTPVRKPDDTLSGDGVGSEPIEGGADGTPLPDKGGLTMQKQRSRQVMAVDKPPAKRGPGRPRRFPGFARLPTTAIGTPMQLRIEKWLRQCERTDPDNVPPTMSECVRRLVDAGLRAEGIRS